MAANGCRKSSQVQIPAMLRIALNQEMGARDADRSSVSGVCQLQKNGITICLDVIG